MTRAIDPFEQFRKERAREGRGAGGPDRQMVSDRIANIIDGVTVPDPALEVEPQLPSPDELKSTLERLIALAERGDDHRSKDAATFLNRIHEAASQLLDGEQKGRISRRGAEYEIGLEDLFHFMRDPDVGRLRNAGGLPASRR